MKIELRISEVGITLETGQAVWEAARDLLSTYGVLVTHPRLKADLKAKNGLEFAGERVRIAPELFEARYPSPFTKHQQRRTQAANQPRTSSSLGEIIISAGGFSMDVVDWRTGELRPATVRDLAESVRVVEACGSGGAYCVTPQDVPPLLQDVVTYKTCFENGRRVRGAYYSSPRQAPFIEEMCEVMGEPFRLLLGVVSPLKMADGDLDNIYRASDAGKRYPISLVGYGVPGVASPAGLAASAALVMAENYGAAILVSLAFPEHKVSASVHAGGPTDFRYCNYAFGAPHTFAYQVINQQLSAALEGIDPLEHGVRISHVSMMTGACVPDEQAAAEKASHAMLGALLGARTFGSAGNLCVDDVFSLEQYIVDREIAEHVVKTVECCEPSALMADLSSFAAEMESIMAGGDFLALPSTLQIMRAFYRPSSLFEHMKLRTWQGKGCPTLRERARNVIERKLAESSFRLDTARARELDRIYAAAEKALCG